MINKQSEKNEGNFSEIVQKNIPYNQIGIFSNINFQMHLIEKSKPMA
jgi:hypothetical protein